MHMYMYNCILTKHATEYQVKEFITTQNSSVYEKMNKTVKSIVDCLKHLHILKNLAAGL